jgi:epoxyqueuosine reductase
MSVPSRSRRDFLKELAVLGAGSTLAGTGWGRGLALAEKLSPAATGLEYKAKTVSVSHFPELQAFIDGLRRDDKISHHKVYRSYIDDRKFAVPDDFKDATAVVILAYRTPLLRFNVPYRGRSREIVISPQYFDDGVTRAALEAAVRRDIVKDPAARLEPAKGLHLKLLAVRSGLARYGRNNIAFVDGLGTYIALYPFLTDAQGFEDSWGELALLDACRECPLCYSLCPTGAIRRENFVIDAGRCLTLYNEIDGKFPNWVLPGMHNALMGCLKCQHGCPENQKTPCAVVAGEDLSEEETRRILEGRPDDRLLETLGRKLKNFPPAADRSQFPVLTRNLKALLHA